MTRLQRRYQCLDCGHRWARTFNVDSPIDDPACPRCNNTPAPTPERVAAPAIATTKSKAIDLAWDIAQSDHQLTNMRDDTHEGETAFIAPPSAPAPTPTNIQRPGFMWGGASSGAVTLPDPPQLVSQSRGAAMLARAEGRGPMELLHKARPKLQAIPLNKGG